MKEKVAKTLSRINLPQKPAILTKFDRLQAGESMIIANEYNPTLLYYQLLADRGNIFDWEYLDKGHPNWRVKITRISPYTLEPTVGELAARDFRMAAVFQQLGINYCCEGKKTVKESCQAAGVAPLQINEQYQQLAEESADKLHDFSSWKPAFLAKYILETFHRDTKEHLDTLYTQALDLTTQEGPQQAAFQELADRLKHFFTHLNEHLQREEHDLYPLIDTLETARKRKRRMVVPIVPPVSSRVQELEVEHTLLGQELKNFRSIVQEYSLQARICTQCQPLYDRLEELGNDLMLHIHLENNVLFPKVLAVEKELGSRSLFSR